MLSSERSKCYDCFLNVPSLRAVFSMVYEWSMLPSGDAMRVVW